VRPVRTPTSTAVYSLPGGNEDNFLYGEYVDGTLKSVWELSPEERTLLAGGARVSLFIFGSLVPPVALSIDRPFCSSCKQQMEWQVEPQAYGCNCQDRA